MARRIHAMETLLEAIDESGSDGNARKVGKIVDTLYAMGLMPVTQTDLDAFEQEYDRPTRDGNYYVACAKHVGWLDQNGVGYTILRGHDYGVSDLVLDPAGEAAFRTRWVGSQG
ncbi:MAG: hypothetical protein ABW048_13055 [Sphingobium sp.]